METGVNKIFSGIKFWLLTDKIRFFLVTAAIAIVVIFLLDLSILSPENGTDVLVEAHGMLFDIILFGVILTLYERSQDRKRKKEAKEFERKLSIRRYTEELEDFRGWYEEEAAHRIWGIIKRLESLGVGNLEFTHLHLGRMPTNRLVRLINDENLQSNGEVNNIGSLAGADFTKANLENVELRYIDLRNADFSWANLKNAKLWLSNLSGVNFSRANLQFVKIGKTRNLRNARFVWAKCEGINLCEADMEGADCIGAQFNSANLSYANLRGAKLKQINIEGADLRHTKLEGAQAFSFQRVDFEMAGAPEDELLKMEWWKENPKSKILLKPDGEIGTIPFEEWENSKKSNE